MGELAVAKAAAVVVVTAAEVAAAVAQTGASGPQDMGKVMGILSAKLAGKADGKIIAALVKETLSN